MTYRIHPDLPQKSGEVSDKVMIPAFTWDHIVWGIDTISRRGLTGDHNSEKNYGWSMMYADKGKPPTFIIYHTQIFPEINEFLETYFAEPHSKGLVNAHIYCTMGMSNNYLSPHFDKEDNYIFQMHGKTKWMISDNHFMLNAGEAVLLEEFDWHCATPTENRISLSVGVLTEEKLEVQRERNERAKLKYGKETLAKGV
jgi:hypothetical protein